LLYRLVVRPDLEQAKHRKVTDGLDLGDW